MLTNVVLPAPLLPTRPTRSPAATSMVTPSAATMPSKCFDSDRAERTGVICGSFANQRAQAARHEANHHEEEDAERHLPRIGEIGAREGAHQLEDERGDEHGDHAVVAGKDRDEDELAGGGPVA